MFLLGNAINHLSGLLFLAPPAYQNRTIGTSNWNIWKFVYKTILDFVRTTPNKLNDPQHNALFLFVRTYLAFLSRHNDKLAISSNNKVVVETFRLWCQSSLKPVWHTVMICICIGLKKHCFVMHFIPIRNTDVRDNFRNTIMTQNMWT